MRNASLLAYELASGSVRMLARELLRPAFRGPPRVPFRYGPATRTHPADGVVNGLQVLGFPSGLPSSYGASDCYPDGTDSRWTQQPFLDAHRGLTLTRATLSSYASSPLKKGVF